MSNTVVRTNVLAINSHRNLGLVGNQQARASARLSSGFRVNSAADDAAGLSISEGMRAQIRGMNQATRNAQDGISLIQTAEGYMQTITEMVQKARELAVQAATDSYSPANRDTIADEISQLRQEVDRIWNSATFNGQQLFRAGGAAPTPTAGPPVLNITNATAFGSWAGSVSGANAAVSNGNFSDLSTYQVAELVNFINANTTLFTGTTAIDDDTAGITGLFTGINGATGTHTLVSEVSLAAFLNEVRLAINVAANGISARDVVVGDLPTTPGGAVSALQNAGTAALVDLFNSASGLLILQAAASGAGLADFAAFTAILGAANVDAFTAAVSLTDNVTSPWAPVESVAVATQQASFVAWLNSGASALLTIREGVSAANITGVFEPPAPPPPPAGSIALLNTNFHLQVGPDSGNNLIVNMQPQVAALEARIALTAVAAATGSTPVALGGWQVAAANDHAAWSTVIADINSTLTDVNDLRAALGATQNRLEFTVDNLQISAENLSASESRIRDADMAAEMMRLTQANVLQQAATAMLAQANQAPQSVLQLLG